MEKLKQLTVNDFSRISQNWNKQSQDLLVFIDGSSSMFGGESRMAHLILHGENSIKETGSVTVKGVATVSYNIARGANGDNSQSVKYYKDYDNFDSLSKKTPTYFIKTEGACSGGEDALCSIISAKRDFLKGE